MGGLSPNCLSKYVNCTVLPSIRGGVPKNNQTMIITDAHYITMYTVFQKYIIAQLVSEEDCKAYITQMYNTLQCFPQGVAKCQVVFI